MDYPQRLIPQVDYKIMAIETGVLDSHYLVRHTKGRDLLDPTTNELKRAYVGEQTYPLRDISVNLIGGAFLVSDVYLIHHREDPDFAYFNYEIWQEGKEIVKIPQSEFISEDRTRGYYFLHIGTFQDLKISYTDDNNAEHQAEIKVLHTPTQCNFWHCSLRTFSHEGDFEPLSEKEIKRPWRKGLLTTLRTMIIQNAILDETLIIKQAISFKLYQI
ncbi:MAG: hypothetical protein RLZZ292_620 [Bacteroidota bacterium]|jgi:hypothetical protein